MAAPAADVDPGTVFIAAGLSDSVGPLRTDVDINAPARHGASPFRVEEIEHASSVAANEDAIPVRHMHRFPLPAVNRASRGPWHQNHHIPVSAAAAAASIHHYLHPGSVPLGMSPNRPDLARAGLGSLSPVLGNCLCSF